MSVCRLLPPLYKGGGQPTNDKPHGFDAINRNNVYDFHGVTTTDKTADKPTDKSVGFGCLTDNRQPKPTK